MNPWRLEVFEELASTSDLCLARAEAGEPAGLAVLALRQTAGRGSRGRGWLAPVGNLNLSVLLRPDRPVAESGHMALLAGIAVAEAIENAAGIATQLKWPNDVLLGGAKLAGILVETSPAVAKLDWLVLGIGINLAEAPDIPGRATTALRAHGEELAPRDAAAAVLAALARWHERPAEAIRETWLTRAHPLGTELTVQGREPRQGRFAGLSPAGELLLACNDRIEPFSTGDVLLGRA
ncbi:MAG: biotin--[acetyl-CoA-carboxylase] ligase [Acidocella sp. 20-61-6]|nr:MAG: biotin--[acetyl-CoA-carboxylase] ligase [Acidocella sp. 20-61-6]